MEKLAAYVVREGGLSTDDAVGWIVRLTTTLEPIHGLGVSHGRVSTKALQIAGPSCRSTAHLLDAGDLTDDPAYFSLERVVEGRRSPADDTWAVGVTLYRMLTGELPYPGATKEEMRALITRAPPSPLAVFDVGDDDIQTILDQVFAARPEQRIVRLDRLREALVRTRPALAHLPPLAYGRPDAPDDDEDEEEVQTTSVFNMDEGEVGEIIREAKRRIVGASALPQGSVAPRSVRPPPRPMTATAPPVAIVDTRAGLEIIESAIGGLPLPPAPTPPAAPAPEAPTEPLVPPPPRLPRSTPPALAPIEREADEVLERPSSIPPPMPVFDDVDEPEPAPEHWVAPPTDLSIGDHSSSQAHVNSIDPKRAARGNITTWVLGAICMFGGAGAAYVTLKSSPQAAPAPVAIASSIAPATGSISAAPSAPPAPSASTAPSASAAVAPADTAPDRVAACVMKLFPPDTFEGRTADLPTMCSTTNPIRGSKELHGEVVRAGGGDKGITTGMGEMSTMGWYRLAAFAVMRGHCCTDAPPFNTPTTLECNLDHTLERLSREVNSGGDLAAEAALQQVTSSFYCLARGGGSELFGQPGMPSGGELTTFLKVFARVRQKAMSQYPQ